MGPMRHHTLGQRLLWKVRPLRPLARRLLYRGLQWPEGARFAVALTFDMDYESDEEALPLVLEQLRTLTLPASFAVIGKRVESVPELYGSLVEQGHEIINHSYSHPYHRDWRPDRHWHQLDQHELEKEISSAHEAIQQACGYQCVGFRTPHFERHLRTAAVLKRLGYLYDSSGLAAEKAPTRSLPTWENDLLQVPIYREASTFQCLRGKPDAVPEWKRKLFCIMEKESRIGGLICVYFDPQDLAGCREALNEWVEALRARRAWFARLRDVADFLLGP